MVLVDPVSLNVKQTIPNTINDQVIQLDSSMRSILNDNNLNVYEKIDRYKDLLQQYLKRVEQIRKKDEYSQKIDNTPPSQLDTKEESNFEKEISSDKRQRFEERILQSLPQSFRDKGKIMLSHIKDASDIKWNDRGEIIIKHNKIPNSNISDLMHEAIRPRKKRTTTPIGWKNFKTELQTSNVPVDLIGNRDTWFQNITDNTESTPVKKRKKDKKSTKTKIIWDSE